MLRREQLLSEMHLRNLEIVNNIPSGRKTHRPPNSNRTLMKLYLTRQILEECLETLDIFKEILEDPIQKSKLVRDVGKNIRLKVYDEDAVVYCRGDTALEFYLLVKGEVSLRMPVYKQVGDERTTVMSEQEIDTVKQGTGFGQAEFIHGKKRSLIAKAQVDDTVIGVIQGSAFEQIIQSYKQRVYYKKMQMFSKCPLLNSIHPTQLQFIVNNAKPIVIPISKQIVRQGQVARSLFLITDGKVQIRKQPKRERLLTNFSKYRLIFNGGKDCVEEKIKIKNIVIAVIGQGEFIGDRQLAMGERFGYTVVAQTEKVRAYVCDERIILSQISHTNLQQVNEHYHKKQLYREQKSQIYNTVKSKLQKKLKTSQRVVLSSKQRELKKMIMNRYVEESPSIIGRMSPREINKSIDVKYLRLRTEPRNKLAEGQIPSLSVLPPVKKLKADKRAYSPLLKMHLSQLKKDADTTPTKNLSKSVSCHQQYEIEVMPDSQTPVERVHSRPLLVFMKPFTKKVDSLYERLTRNYNYFTNQNHKVSGKSSRNTLESYSIIEMKRVKQYLSRSKSKKIHQQIQ